jgi:hypothetical protein
MTVVSIHEKVFFLPVVKSGISWLSMLLLPESMSGDRKDLYFGLAQSTAPSNHGHLHE